jgi:hypothetical protein
LGEIQRYVCEAHMLHWPKFVCGLI